MPKSMVRNLNQTPLKCSPCSRQTLAQKNSKNFLIPCLYADRETAISSISGSHYKHGLTGTFVITLDGNCLPFQLIYDGKTERSLANLKSPDDSFLSVNVKYFSNTKESLKIFREVIIPYLTTTKKRKREKLSSDHIASNLFLENFFFIIYFISLYNTWWFFPDSL